MSVSPIAPNPAGQTVRQGTGVLAAWCVALMIGSNGAVAERATEGTPAEKCTAPSLTAAGPADAARIEANIAACTKHIQSILGSRYTWMTPEIDYEWRAQWYFLKGDFEGAVADADRCWEWRLKLTDPDKKPDTGCLQMVANGYFKLGKHDQAISAYEKLLLQRRTAGPSLVQEVINAFSARIKLSAAENRFANVIADYEATIKVFDTYRNHPLVSIPGDVIAASAAAYERVGDETKAANIYTDLIQKDARNADALLLRGRVRLGQGDMSGALADFDAAFQSAAPEPEYQLLRARTGLALGKFDAAVADFSALIASAPTTGNYVARALAYRAARNDEAALADLNEAIKRDGNSADTYFIRACVHAARKNDAGALADFDAAVRLDPTNPTYLTMRGLIQAAGGHFDEAIADYGRAIERDPANAQRWIQRAWARFKSGKTEEGLGDADRAVALDHGSASALATRGYLYEALGKKSEAIADFKAALTGAPGWQDAVSALQRLGAQ